MLPPHRLDRLSTKFDDNHLIAHAGLIQLAMLAQRLGLHGMFDEYVRLGKAPGMAQLVSVEWLTFRAVRPCG